MTGGTWYYAKKQHLIALGRWIEPREPWGIPLSGALAGRKTKVRSSFLIYETSDGISAVLSVTDGGVLNPVFHESYEPDHLDPPPAKLLPPKPFSIMGKEPWARQVLDWYGRTDCRTVEYYLMVRKSLYALSERKLPGITVKKMGLKDLDGLLMLQEGYELEEVLLEPEAFNPRISRINLERLLSEELVYAALDSSGKALAKANTNTRALNCYQIGGVYTLPGLRGQGLGKAVMDSLVRDIESREKTPCLFVKQENLPAISLYLAGGFKTYGTYLIAYPGKPALSHG
ncbi:MAG: GNAT family N-acetyltransferase [Spirochaetales bacterium]|nr:GNAT family N-acetyltransferase [Spirochaetales bacterium]